MSIVRPAKAASAKMAGSFAIPALAAAMLLLGGAAPANAYVEAPFCAENQGRAGFGKQCRFYTFAQCTEFTSGIGGSCFANPMYRYQPEPRRYRSRRYQQD